ERGERDRHGSFLAPVPGRGDRRFRHRRTPRYRIAVARARPRRASVSPIQSMPPARSIATVLRTGLVLVWWAIVPILPFYTFLALRQRLPWYLAVDQFGYVTFAHDLLHGHVFHDWPPLRGLRAVLAPRTDVLAQTYVLDQGRLYCRYAPGFPIILAAWLAVFGDDWAHYLNPVLFIGLLLMIIAFQ